MVGEKKLRELFNKALREGWTPKQLALSVAVGMYVAFSPFPLFHTVLMLGLKWLLRLNFPVLFIAASVNNPWTMVPLYSLDYGFGYWVVHHLFGLSPLWNLSLEKIFGSGSICVWSFFVGGNILGVVAAGISYPLFRALFGRILAAKHDETDLVVPAHREPEMVVIGTVVQNQDARSL